jgi:hypothetical protein
MADTCDIWIRFYEASLLSTPSYDDCWVNGNRVYQCAEHAGEPTPSYLAKGAVGTYNARTQTITLRGANRSTVRPRPKWMTRYRWVLGFIVPYDRNGALLSSLVAKHQSYTKQFEHGCGHSYDAGHLVTSCALGLYVIYPRWPLHKGDLMAFAGERGTHTYTVQRYDVP